jgi:hypothetical protein
VCIAEPRHRKEKLVHPYKALPPSSFWKTAVSERNYLDFSDIYKKKFDINPNCRIVTAGSCFAQHIAKRLHASGFNYCDYEPAPVELPEHVRQKFGYEIYSARYNNIYTARQLLQMFQRAFGEFTPAERMWDSGERIFDPFRPTVEPNGFASADEFEASQHSHFAAVRRVFQESDLFIFTLGLTEAWISALDGAVFPVCPGTAAGRFDPATHVFRNLSFNETLHDMRAVIDKARNINPRLRFLLTVSPVPLTATASSNHVLVATTYSKSVLRAVAGELEAQYPFVDYFPSYELVAAHPVRAMLYDPNLRSVTGRGVDLVMRHFFSEHGLATQDKIARPTVQEPESEISDETGDVVCEEILLAEGR